MKIFLLDNFDSFTFNLVDYFEQLGCEVHVYRNDVPVEKVAEVAPDLIVLSPGPSIPARAGNMMAIIERYHKEIPMFGVCLGHEAFIEFFGGSLKFVEPVHGKSSPIKHNGEGVFDGLEDGFLAGRYHSLCADEVPECLEVTAEFEDLVMAVRHKELPITGVQFHPESVLSMKGASGFKMIENLVLGPVDKFLRDSIDGKLSVDEQVKFLENYTPGKVSAEDIHTFANFMEREMTAHLDMPGAIDVCGTGGSGLPRINTSTIGTFILSDLGVGVAKHGNKAASGRFGSFDLLEELGVDINKDAEQLEKDFLEKKRAFIYARTFHPVMRHFAEARKAIGKPTIFNILGPLLSPANVKKQIIGTSFESEMRLIAEACKLMGRERVMIVCGSDGLDEVTLGGKTHVVELKDGEISEYDISPSDFGISECAFDEVAGGDKDFNVSIAKEILAGKCKSRHADLVYVNVAMALKLAGVEEDLKKGFEMARGAGAVDHSKNILQEIADSKVLQKSDRDFKAALEKGGVIAEIKMASPSEGDIADLNVAHVAGLYEAGAAAAISVLTDEKYFKGGPENMRMARAATTSTPILCKDFIIHEYQIFKAREYGADAILLIAALLDRKQIEKFIDVARGLGMDCLVEVHNEEELEKVLGLAEIIGINNRDLKTFKVDLEVTNGLVGRIPKDIVIVSESGIKSAADVAKLDSRVDAILVGTALMGADDINSKLHEISKAISTK